MPWKGEATKPSCDVKHRKSWLINEKIPKIMLYELMHHLKLFYHSFYKRKSTLFSTGHFKNSQRSYLFVLCGDFFFGRVFELGGFSKVRIYPACQQSLACHERLDANHVVRLLPCRTGGIQKGRK